MVVGIGVGQREGDWLVGKRVGFVVGAFVGDFVGERLVGK